jgi:hypothetical protein
VPRREAASAVVPHHFIRRGAYDWDDPAKLVGSLVAHVPEVREPDGNERMHPATRLGLPPAQRRVDDIPIGLAALIEKSWQRIAVDPIAVDGLGTLAAAREALTLDGLGIVAGWTSEAQRRTFRRGPVAVTKDLEQLRPPGPAVVVRSAQSSLNASA